MGLAPKPLYSLNLHSAYPTGPSFSFDHDFHRRSVHSGGYIKSTCLVWMIPFKPDAETVTTEQRVVLYGED